MENNDLGQIGSPEPSKVAAHGRELVRSLVADAYRDTFHPQATVRALPMSEADRAARIWRFQVSWPAPIAIFCTIASNAPEGAPE